MKSHDSWLLEGHDAGLDDARMPCEKCHTPFEDHNDRALGHKFEPIHEEEGYDGNFNEEV